MELMSLWDFQQLGQKLGQNETWRIICSDLECRNCPLKKLGDCRDGWFELDVISQYNLYRDFVNAVNKLESEEVMNENNKNDYEYVNHPKHYNKEGRKECIVEMEEIFGRDALIKWCRMTAYKYRYRCGDKPDNSDIEDMQKAMFYLDYALKLVEKGKKS